MIAFVFPGQGSQKVGMGRALAEAYPECRSVFEQADAALGEPLSQLCFDGPEDRLVLTENTQPAILTVSVAAARLLELRGLRPHDRRRPQPRRVLGARGGRHDCLCRCSAHRPPARAVHAGGGSGGHGRDGRRARAGGRPGGAACAEAAEGEVVAPANLNAPGQVVIAGTVAAVQRAGERAKARGAKRVIPLPVSAPFHCALMQPAQERLAPALRALPSRLRACRSSPTSTREPKTDGPAAIEALVRQVSAPVRWEDVIGQLASAGVRVVC